MPEEKTTFGTTLRTIRRDAGMTQRELAERTGLDFSYVSKLENGRNLPAAADTIVSICKALDVGPETLLALAGKLPSDVHDNVGTNPAAQEFLREAQKLKLRDEEWRHLGAEVRRMRRLK